MWEPLYALGSGRLQSNSRSVQELLAKVQNEQDALSDVEGNNLDED